MKRRHLAIITTLPLAAAVLIAAPSGAVVPTCNGLEATIVGTSGDDHLTGTSGADVVVLGSGRDTFTGKGGNDTICGGRGDDTLYPGDGNDAVFGEEGNDRIFGGKGSDDLHGGAGIDTLTYASYHSEPSLRLDLRDDTTTKTDGTDSFTGFARYVGSNGADTLIGTTTGDRFYGGGGDDTVYGFGGDDEIYVEYGIVHVSGGDGNDIVHVKGTADGRLALGSGNDVAHFDTGSSRDRWTGGTGVDTLVAHGTAGVEINLNQSFVHTSNGSRWSVGGFENATGTNFKDRLVGNGAANKLVGLGSDDVLIGLGGDDVLLGGYSFPEYRYDTADGGAGNDACHAWTMTSCERRLSQ